MGAQETLAPAAPAPIMAILSQFDRAQLSGFIAVAIDLLDIAEPDADLEDDPLEANGDETDGTSAEDGCGIRIPRYACEAGAGWPIADPGGCQHDRREVDDGI